MFFLRKIWRKPKKTQTFFFPRKTLNPKKNVFFPKKIWRKPLTPKKTRFLPQKKQKKKKTCYFPPGQPPLPSLRQLGHGPMQLPLRALRRRRLGGQAQSLHAKPGFLGGGAGEVRGGFFVCFFLFFLFLSF